MFACLSPSRDGVSVSGDLSPLWCLGMENPYAALKVDLEGSSLPGVQQGFYPGSVSWHSPSARVVSNICFWRVELSMGKTANSYINRGPRSRSVHTLHTCAKTYINSRFF